MKIIIVTHDGGFHSDELFAIALIKKYVSNDVFIIRTRAAVELELHLSDEDVWVVDVGGCHADKLKNFDHHQKGFSAKWKGTDDHYSSCGLVWSYLKKMGLLCQSKWVLGAVERRLIKPIDLHDNGVKSWHLAGVFKMFNRLDKGDDQFFKALGVAESHLDNLIYFLDKEELNRHSIDSCEHSFVCGGDAIVVTSNGFNLIPVIASMTEAKVVIEFKSISGYWSVQSLSELYVSPIHWRGLSLSDLEDASGIKGLIFAHRGGHLVRVIDKATAIMVADRMLEDN